MQQAQNTKDKVSMRQLAMLYIITGFVPAIRFLPSYTALVAEEASWVSPVIAIIPIGITIFFLHKIFSRSKDKSTFDIINTILGKYVGNFMIFIHLVWVLFLLAYYTRLHGERLVSAVFPSINITFFIVIALVVTSFVLRSGATAIARMGEFITPIVILMFIFLTVFLLPKVRIDALLPVYFNDTIPLIKASLGTFSLFSYMVILLMVSTKITGKEKTAKTWIEAGLVYFIMLILLIVMTVGLLGSTVTSRAASPFLIIAKQISILDTIENIEAIVVAMWLLSDAMLIATMALVSLNIMKYFFKLSDQRNIINIMLVFTYIFSLGIASNRFEIDTFASNIIIYFNTIVGFGTPALLYIVGTIRKKI
ncbi:MAG: gerKB4 [Clostridia bacterium]|jgi:spore germination protein (amino acid permease)|nr:gerKB4 [Clostridia bacterium]